MNKRFITLAVAVLLGLASGQSVPTEPVTPVTPTEPVTPATPTEPVTPVTPTEPVTPATPTDEALQNDFEANNKLLEKTWDSASIKSIGCNLYDDFAFFNLQRLDGPYSKNIVVDGYSRKVEVRFCSPVPQADQSDKSSLAFLIDASGAREKRLTSGSTAVAYTETRRSVDEDGDQNVAGIYYKAKNSSDVCAYDAAGKELHYATDFLVTCDRDATGELHHDDLLVWQDAHDKCQFHVQASHAAGCPTLEIAGFVQYIMNHPWLVAAGLLAFGVTATFFGGYLFDYVVASLAGIMVFFVVALLTSALGGFVVLEKHSSASFGRVVAALFSFLLAAGLAVLAGWFVKKTSRIAMGLLGGIGGLFLAFLAYSLLFAKFVTGSTWLLWLCLIGGVAAGGFLAYKFKNNILIQLTATVGSYMIIRAISLVAGGYINEFEMMSQMKSGNFELPNTFYAYLAGFVALAVGGTFFQYKKGYDKHVNVDGGNLDEHFLPK